MVCYLILHSFFLLSLVFSVYFIRFSLLHSSFFFFLLFASNQVWTRYFSRGVKTWQPQWRGSNWLAEVPIHGIRHTKQSWHICRTIFSSRYLFLLTLFSLFFFCFPCTNSNILLLLSSVRWSCWYRPSRATVSIKICGCGTQSDMWGWRASRKILSWHSWTRGRGYHPQRPFSALQTWAVSWLSET